MNIRENIKEWRELHRDYSKDSFNNLIGLLGETPQIKLLEDVLKFYKAKSHKLETEALIENMEELDLRKFETDDYKAEIKQKISTKTIDKGLLLAWLSENNYTDIITEVLSFPKGELKSEELDYLKEKGLSFTRDSSAPAPSVKKLVKDRIEHGEKLPSPEALQINFFDYVKIKEK